MGTYNHQKIEDAWKKHWFDNNLYKAVDFSEKPKKYILAELPYPSGKILHVGHMMRYTVPEIYSRFLRMQGYNVLFPMGWDSFGLPAETYAIKNGTTPQKAVAEAAINYRQAMQDMGYAIDWDRELATSDPQFYKWTQWMFIKLWEAGLARQKEMPVWWCKELGVLADEEVLPDDGSPTGRVSERGGHVVERKMYSQWVLDIPAYAERMLADLDTVDYLPAVKHGQVNWIGKKEGLNISYPVDGLSGTETTEIICFTTRADTNFGATFIVVAPEHEFAQKVAKDNAEVAAYISTATAKTELERVTEGKEKTGVFTGFYALNRLNIKKLPIYVSDFVLGHYGTGAVVGVPGHDARDFDFAQKFGLEVVRVIAGPNGNSTPVTDAAQIYTDEGTVLNSDFLDGLNSAEALTKVSDYLIAKGWAEKATTYKIREQIFSRQRYWGEPIPLVHTQDGEIEAVPENDLPLELPIMEDFLASDDGVSPLAKNTDWIATTDSKGNPATRETDTMPTWAGSNWYYIRYIDPHNDQEFADMAKLKYWMPVDKYFGDAGHTTAHLIYCRFWYKFLYDQGLVPHPEPIHWRMSGGLLLGGDHKKMSKSRPDYVVDPKDVMENYGADAARVYLAFLGPYDESYPWNTNGIKACYRVMREIYEQKSKITTDKAPEHDQVIKAFHKMVKNMTSMMENLKMNTAVSEIMKFVNVLKKHETIPSLVWQDFLKCIAPFAPFLAEELWQEAHGFKEWKNENSVHMQSWPVFDPDLVQDETFELPVQINGKLRATLSVNKNSTETEIHELVLGNNTVKSYLKNRPIEKFVYIPGKIVNLVV